MQCLGLRERSDGIIGGINGPRKPEPETRDRPHGGFVLARSDNRFANLSYHAAVETRLGKDFEQVFKRKAV